MITDALILKAGSVIVNAIGRILAAHAALRQLFTGESRGSVTNPMSFIPVHNQSSSLQSTLSSCSAGNNNTEQVFPHHPITCSSELNVDFEVRGFSCEHVMVNMDTDTRTKACCIHSVVLLLLEPAVATGSEWKYRTPDELIEEWNKTHPEEPWN